MTTPPPLSRMASSARQPGFASKLLLIVAGGLAGLLIVETALRFGGWAYIFLQNQENRRVLERPGSIRVLCLGESTTAMGGKDSFPSQLDVALNARAPGTRFSVVNRGIPTISTAGILERLEENLSGVRPDIVVVMMGINDELFPFENFNEERLKYGRYTWRMQALDALNNLRLRKLFKRFMDARSPSANRGRASALPDPLRGLGETEKLEAYVKQWKTNINILNALSNQYVLEGKTEKAEQLLLNTLQTHPEMSADIQCALARVYTWMNQSDKAINAYMKAAETSPDNSGIYLDMGQAYFKANRREEAEFYFKKALGLCTNEEHVLMISQKLGEFYEANGRWKEAEKLYRETADQHPENDQIPAAMARMYASIGRHDEAARYFKRAESLRNGRYIPATRENYLRLSREVLSRGIQLICVQYPVRSVTSLKKMLAPVSGITFVDNEQLFKDQLALHPTQELFSDMFAGDFGHFTPFGARLLADNVADVILRQLYGID